MGVYAKGMEMPKTCFLCIKSGLQRIVKCEEWRYTTAGVRERYRIRSCPLVDVPEPHGRLIDGDKLSHMIESKTAEPDYQHTCEDWRAGLYLADELAWDLPTVIEAEDE